LLIFNTGLLDLDEDLGDYEQQEERLKRIAPKIQGEWQPRCRLRPLA